MCFNLKIICMYNILYTEMKTTHFFDCVKQPEQVKNELERIDDFSHIFKSDVSNKTMATLIIGRRECGKTHLVKDIINSYNEHNMIEELYIFTHEHKKQNYTDIVYNIDDIMHLPINNYETYFEDFLKMVGEKQHKKYVEGKNNSSKNTMIVLDDIISNHKITRTQEFKNFICNIHTLGINLICTLQFSTGICPEMRYQFDNVILFKDNNISNIKRCYEHYFGMISKFEYFNHFVSKLDNYECLMLSRNGKKINLYKSNYITPNNKIKLNKFNVKIDNKNDKNIEILKKIEKNNLGIKKITEENNKLIKLLNYT